MTNFKKIGGIIILLSLLFVLNSCNALKYRPVDASEYPPEPEKRVKKILRKEKVLEYLILIKKIRELLILQAQMSYGEHR